MLVMTMRSDPEGIKDRIYLTNLPRGTPLEEVKWENILFTIILPTGNPCNFMKVGIEDPGDRLIIRAEVLANAGITL